MQGLNASRVPILDGGGSDRMDKANSDNREDYATSSSFGGCVAGNNGSLLYRPRASLTRSRTRQSLVFPNTVQSLATSATCENVSILAAGRIDSERVLEFKVAGTVPVPSARIAGFW